MTLPYEWNPMPHTLDVRCPSCRKQAFFEFAEIVQIREKKDVPFFQESDQFDYLLCQDSCGHRWHAAVYYAGLHGRTVETIRELPEGYERSDWMHSKYLYRSPNLGSGSITCSSCTTFTVVTNFSGLKMHIFKLILKETYCGRSILSRQLN